MGTSFSERRLRKILRAILWKLGEVLAPAVLWGFGMLPRETLHAMARGIGSFWFHAVRSSRQLGMENLDLVYGDSISPEQKAIICRESFTNILTCMLDYYHYSSRTGEYRDKVVMDPVSEARVKALLEKGTGAFFFSGHLGNWELLAGYMSLYARAWVLSRRERNFNHYIVDCRLRHGVGSIPAHETLPRDIISRVRRGDWVGFVLDRNLRNTKGLMVDFLGSPAFTPYFPILLALKSNVPVVGIFMVQEGSGYRLIVEEPIEVRPLESREATYRHYTQVFSDIVAKQIRAHPGQWFWAHKRWGKPKGAVAFSASSRRQREKAAPAGFTVQEGISPAFSLRGAGFTVTHSVCDSQYY